MVNVAVQIPFYGLRLRQHGRPERRHNQQQDHLQSSFHFVFLDVLSTFSPVGCGTLFMASGGFPRRAILNLRGQWR